MLCNEFHVVQQNVAEFPRTSQTFDRPGLEQAVHVSVIKVALPRFVYYLTLCGDFWIAA
jgi:hypothetical protein